MSESTPPVIREVIDPDGDVLLQLLRLVAPSDNATNDNKSDDVMATDADGDDSVNGGAGSVTPGKDKVEQTVELVVSSKILCLVSPVFRILLRGPFGEAAAFSALFQNKRDVEGNCKSIGPANDVDTDGSGVWPPEHGQQLYTLVLPEDDATAMTLLMQTLHFRVGDVYETASNGIHAGLPDPELLEKLAFVCNKYDCASALRGVGDTWVREHIERLPAAYANALEEASDNKHCASVIEAKGIYLGGWCRLLVFAYVVDLPRLFSDLSWHLIINHEGPISSSQLANAHKDKASDVVVSVPAKALSNHPLLPRDLTGKDQRICLRNVAGQRGLPRLFIYLET
ncbi:hypothetical protein SPI_07986 [Niveomyces insectorum RCEF 264]|uniref:BTB domain-containing protein n=1 Tax=Niveomyces insectorum RCEF 264 TaxID=1081102 RepID=A0A167NPP6_9HYPO|nr:hypothetical protein SPI_07986 [Niveomyces insectorum RCEF 264]